MDFLEAMEIVARLGQIFRLEFPPRPGFIAPTFCELLTHFDHTTLHCHYSATQTFDLQSSPSDFSFFLPLRPTNQLMRIEGGSPVFFKHVCILRIYSVSCRTSTSAPSLRGGPLQRNITYSLNSSFSRSSHLSVSPHNIKVTLSIPPQPLLLAAASLHLPPNRRSHFAPWHLRSRSSYCARFVPSFRPR